MMTLKSFLILCVIVGAKCVERFNLDRESVEKVWNAHKKTHKLQFNEEEDNSRFELFHENLKFIDEHNSEYEEGKHTYHLGITQFTHMTDAEFKSINGFRAPPPDFESEAHTYNNYSSDVVLPDNLDWRKKGIVTPVKNQQMCRSCWAFSAVAALESANVLMHGNKLVSLSEQQIIDCDQYDDGCSGGFMDSAFKYIKANGGIDTEESYKYKAKEDKCKFNKSTIGAKCNGFVNLPANETIMKFALNANPLSVAVMVTKKFGHYKGGILNDPLCNGTHLDHGVAIVGYGVKDDQDFWIVKNSWGKNWGEEGYIRIERNVNRCGIKQSASYPFA